MLNLEPTKPVLAAVSEATPDGGQRSTGTPSPELPSPTKDPVTPIPDRAKRKQKEDAGGGLGLQVPEVDVLVTPGKQSEARKINFAPVGLDPAGKERAATVPLQVHDSESEEDPAPSSHGLAMQISPRRPPVGSSSAWPSSSSPLRPSASAPQGPSLSGAHELLHAIVRDAMADFRLETRGDVMGLHLDLVKMGRGWRKELKEGMEGMQAEIRALREENARLREENERLRRGY
jgi:protein NEDD1